MSHKEEVAWRAYNAQYCQTEDLRLTPESCVWLGLGNRSYLVEAREILWFCLKVIKHVVSEVNFGLLSQIIIFL